MRVGERTDRAGDGDFERAWCLVHAYGWDTLAYFALRRDKRYFFSSDGEAVIAYAQVGGFALASGDPIGREGSIDRVIAEFRAMCRRRSWGCAFLAARASESDRYASHGLHASYLGDEAVIECGGFSLQGKRGKSMRQSVNRVARSYRFSMFPESSASSGVVAQLNEVSRRWRGRAPERGFSMTLSQPVGVCSAEFRLCVAFDDRGVPGGFLRLVPLFGGASGMTLDMMRRDPGSPNGMTEFLVSGAVFALRDAGIAELSMNFATMRRLFVRDVPLSPDQRALRAFVALGNPFFQIESLYEFSRRFRPRWEPRTIVVDYRRSLPVVALLYARVEGFLVFPWPAATQG